MGFRKKITVMYDWWFFRKNPYGKGRKTGVVSDSSLQREGVS